MTRHSPGSRPRHTLSRTSIKHIAAGVLIATCACVLVGQNANHSQPVASRPAATAPAENRWEAEIAAFETYDLKNTPARDAILFTGSSTMVFWQTATSFSNLTVLNRGFGGSQYSDLVHYYDRVIKPYKPRAIVLYSGDNDTAEGRSASEIHASFCELMRRIRDDFADVLVVVISIKPSHARWALWPTMQNANALIEGECRRGRGMRFVDIGPALLGEDGMPRAALFEKDGLHLNSDGYRVLAELIRPVLISLEKPVPAR